MDLFITTLLIVALFILLGTTNGGNGTPTFVLPNLQGLVRLRFRAKAGPLAL